jgi:hypothetical protein
MKPKDIPRSPLANERNAGLPQCSAISKTTDKPCRSRIAGRQALENLGLLEHEHAGEYCAFHLLGGRELSSRAAASKRQAKKLAAQAKKLDAALPGITKPADKSQPGEEVVEIDAALGVLRLDGTEPVGPEPAVATALNLNTIKVGRVFEYLTPEQRKRLLRARLLGR